ncbi:MAG TPA: HAMP domain-containing sensor histidine kinase [Chitinispirillaceae bacterium]|nr:HAMP domain-containing sensor histidine kinase [Chitinispirillaceae bacterium]
MHRFRRIVRQISRWNVLRKVIAVSGRKAIFGTGALLIVLYNGFAIFSTRHLKSERQRVADAYVKIAEEHLLKDTNSVEVLDAFFDVIRVIELPVIITDTNWVPLRWDNLFQLKKGSFRRTEVLRLPLKKLDVLQRKVNTIKKQNKPYPLFVQDGKVKVGYLLIGNNLFLNILSYLPYFEIVILCAFFAITYVVFQIVRSTEKSNLWVGLAKETAHQLGTPISSLMGWTEYIRTIHEADPPIEPEVFMSQIRKICDDMDNDLIRLRKVTARFSQIGSIPALSTVDVNELIGEVTEYYKIRLPLLRKHIDIKFELGDVPGVSANRDLIEWVLENLLKNSIDAFMREDGLIEIKTEFVESEKIVRVIQRDNGKGMTRDVQHQIFNPGFTTKKRGWGLGLTLSKRIVEDYHNGRIYVSWSQKDKGTVFCIDLPIAAEL